MKIKPKQFYYKTALLKPEYQDTIDKKNGGYVSVKYLGKKWHNLTQTHMDLYEVKSAGSNVVGAYFSKAFKDFYF